MYDIIQRWYKIDGELFLKNIGIHPGHIVLDFGCGDGNYSIPAAKVVGNMGKVYALDQNSLVLNKLMQKASSMGLYNITIVHTLEELALSLKDDLLDIVLLYDVIHSYYFTEHERRNLFESIRNMVKRTALISIFPKHMDHSEIRKIGDEMSKLGFFLKRKISLKLIHNGGLETGSILNYRKET